MAILGVVSSCTFISLMASFRALKLGLFLGSPSQQDAIWWYLQGRRGEAGWGRGKEGGEKEREIEGEGEKEKYQKMEIKGGGGGGIRNRKQVRGTHVGMMVCCV